MLEATDLGDFKALEALSPTMSDGGFLGTLAIVASLVGPATLLALPGAVLLRERARQVGLGTGPTRWSWLLPCVVVPFAAVGWLFLVPEHLRTGTSELPDLLRLLVPVVLWLLAWVGHETAAWAARQPGPMGEGHRFVATLGTWHSGLVALALVGLSTRPGGVFDAFGFWWLGSLVAVGLTAAGFAAEAWVARRDGPSRAVLWGWVALWSTPLLVFVILLQIG